MKNKPIIYDTWKSNFDLWLSNIEQLVSTNTDIDMETYTLGSDASQIDIII